MGRKECKKGQLVFFEGEQGEAACGRIQWVLKGVAMLRGESFSGIIQRPINELYPTAEAYFGLSSPFRRRR